MDILRKTFVGALALAGIAFGAQKAEAAVARGYAAYNANLMAGPGNYYPILLTIPRGSRLTIFGCFYDWSWCDVAWGYERGWVTGDAIRVLYYNRPVYLRQYGGVVGIPFITFNFFIYWDNHYRSRPFYREYNRYFQFYSRDDRRGIDHRRDDDRRRNDNQNYGQGGNANPGNRDHDPRIVPGPNAGSPGYGKPGPNNNYNGRNENNDRRFIPAPNGGTQGYVNPGNNNGRNDNNDRRFIPGPNNVPPGYANPGGNNNGNNGRNDDNARRFAPPTLANPGNGNQGNNNGNERRFVPGQNGNAGNGKPNQGNGCQPGTHPTQNGCVADGAPNGGNGPDAFRGRGR